MVVLLQNRTEVVLLQLSLNHVLVGYICNIYFGMHFSMKCIQEFQVNISRQYIDIT